MFNKTKMFFAPENEGGAAAPAATTTENPVTADTSDVTAVLHYDPFKKGDEIPEAKAAAGAKDKTGTDTGAGNEEVVTPAKDAPKKEEPANSGNDDQAKHWRDIAEARQADLDRVSKKPTGGAEEEEGPKIPEYNFNIPDPLINLLTSEKVEDFKTGVQALAKGIAGAIHAQMAVHMSEQFDPRFQSMPQQIMQILGAQTQAKAVSDDFYGTYPELNHPSIKGLVKQTGEALAKKLGKTAWDKELRDATATEVKAIMAIAAGQKTNGKDTSPPRMLSTQGARPAVNSSDSESRDIVDTLFSQLD